MIFHEQLIKNLMIFPYFFHFYKFQELFMKFNDFSMILKQIWISMISRAVGTLCNLTTPHTVETLYSTIPYTTIFYIRRWTHEPQNLLRPIRNVIMLLVFFNKTNKRVTCLFTDRAVDYEWTHMWPVISVNNDGRIDYLRLSHLTALSAGVNNHLRCIHKGLTASLRVTPPIRMHHQTILTWSFDPMYHHLGCQRKLAPGLTK